MTTHPWDSALPSEVLDLLSREVGEGFATPLPRFIRGMVDRMLMSTSKYGRVTAEAIKAYDLEASLRQRWDRYQDTGNTEWLIDMANFLVLLFTYPPHPQAHFRSTTSAESPGIVAADGTRLFSPQDLEIQERHLRRQQRSGD